MVDAVSSSVVTASRISSTVLGFAPPASRRVVFELFSAGGARRVHGLSSYLYSFKLESDVLLCESRFVIAL